MEEEAAGLQPPSVGAHLITFISSIKPVRPESCTSYYTSLQVTYNVNRFIWTRDPLQFCVTDS
jgi:hypothetical protein